jgi:hypothetical protein
LGRFVRRDVRDVEVDRAVPLGPERPTVFGGADGDVFIVEPEVDLVAWLDAAHRAFG